VFTLEFALARHLFCRFGCAVGLFQSLAWMANPGAW
jgi:ferredoxin-type protein NapH